MANPRYVLKKEKPIVEPIENISVAKMQQLAIERQMSLIKKLGSDITAIKVGSKQFKLRYKDNELELYKSQKFTPYISKTGRLVIVKSGGEELELTEEALRRLKA